MNTTINKALVAVLGGLVVIVNSYFNTDWIISEATISTIAGILTPVLVWTIPNRKA